MLDEDDAFALLKEHCKPLWGCYSVSPAAHPDWVDSTPTQVDFVAQPAWNVAKSREHAVELGARLRLALGVAQTVSRCRGFEPAAQQKFWRRATSDLWDFELYHHAFSASAFMHVGLFWEAESINDVAFWTGFFHGTRECDDELASVLETLGPHLPTDRSPLKVTLARCRTEDSRDSWSEEERKMISESVVPRIALHIILRATLDSFAGSWTSLAALTQLRLVVEFRVDDSAAATRVTLDLLSRARSVPRLELTIDRLVVQHTLRRPDPDRRGGYAFAARAHVLGQVLTTLLAPGETDTPTVESVVLMGCSQSHYRHVGAVLSAVAHTTPSVVSVRCSELCDALQTPDQLMRLA